MNRQLMLESRKVALVLIVACAAVFLLTAFFVATARGTERPETAYGIVTHVENKAVAPTKIVTYVTLVPYDFDDKVGLVMHNERKVTIIVTDNTKVRCGIKPGKRSQIMESALLTAIYKASSKEATYLLIPTYSR